MQDAYWPSHLEEFKQVLFSEPCNSYPSSHLNQQVSLVTKPLQVIYPFGGSWIASQGRPGSNVQRTKTKLCLQNKVCLFLLWDTFPATRHKLLRQSRFPNRQMTASSLEHYLVFVFGFYLIKRRKPSSDTEDRGSKIYKETARHRVLAFTFTCPHVSS